MTKKKKNNFIIYIPYIYNVYMWKSGKLLTFKEPICNSYCNYLNGIYDYNSIIINYIESDHAYTIRFYGCNIEYTQLKNDFHTILSHCKKEPEPIYNFLVISRNDRFTNHFENFFLGS